MPLSLINGDICELQVDAIVNSANQFLFAGGGVDGAIHRAAGPQLQEACNEILRPKYGSDTVQTTPSNDCEHLKICKTGQAVITKGFNLPCRYVIHTVGPIWDGGNKNEKQLLSDCFNNSLKLAKEHECHSVAFPLISTGAYDYPKNEALHVAIDSISQFLEENDPYSELDVLLVIYSSSDYMPDSGLLTKVKDYFVLMTQGDQEACHTVTNGCRELNQDWAEKMNKSQPELADVCNFFFSTNDIQKHLKGAISDLSPSFADLVIKTIDAKKITDAECYRRANISRQNFNKMKNNSKTYRPTRATAAAYAIALRLDLEETKQMLAAAGIALSRANPFDIIISFFIFNKIYDVNAINMALFEYQQPLLGERSAMPKNEGKNN